MDASPGAGVLYFGVVKTEKDRLKPAEFESPESSGRESSRVPLLRQLQPAWAAQRRSCGTSSGRFQIPSFFNPGKRLPRWAMNCRKRSPRHWKKQAGSIAILRANPKSRSSVCRSDCGRRRHSLRIPRRASSRFRALQNAPVADPGHVGARVLNSVAAVATASATAGRAGPGDPERAWTPAPLSVR